MPRRCSLGNCLSMGNVTNELDASGGAVISGACWVRPESGDSTIRTTMGKISDAVPTVQYGCTISGANGAAIEWGDGVGVDNLSGGNGLITVAAGWSHIAFSIGHSGVNNCRLWINGAPIAQMNRTRNLQDTSQEFRIGQRSPGTNQYAFPGLASHVAVWRHPDLVILSDGEVAALARGVSPVLIRPLHLIGYWPIWGLSSPEVDLSIGSTSKAPGALVGAPPAVFDNAHAMGPYVPA